MKKPKSIFEVTYRKFKIASKPGEHRGVDLVTVANVVFNDPSSRNSFRVESARELVKLLPQIEKSADVLVFRSSGRVFCSGGNLKDHIASGRVKSRMGNREITKCLARLSELKIPTLVAVEGDAFGGGLELLSAFDVSVALPHVMLGFWQRRLGLSFGWGGGARLVRRVVSSARLVALALEARAVSADEAVRLGLVDRVVPRWSLESQIEIEVLRLGGLAKESVRALKSLKQVAPVEARREQGLFEKLWFGPVHRAFLVTRASKENLKKR